MLSEKETAVKDLMQIPGVGKSIANDLWNIKIKSVAELKAKTHRSFTKYPMLMQV